MSGSAWERIGNTLASEFSDVPDLETLTRVLLRLRLRLRLRLLAAGCARRRRRPTSSIFPAQAGTQASSVFPAKAGTQASSVFPAQAGTQGIKGRKLWFPACAGTTFFSLRPAELAWPTLFSSMAGQLGINRGGGAG
jgi:hypothetical protein